jgi:hypothetical protein
VRLALKNRLLATVVALASLSAGCIASGGTVHVSSAAIWTAAIAGSVVVLVEHDEHLHHVNCGHYRRWHDERWVYYYDDRWEYYDADRGQWYVYGEAYAGTP